MLSRIFIDFLYTTTSTSKKADPTPVDKYGRNAAKRAEAGPESDSSRRPGLILWAGCARGHYARFLLGVAACDEQNPCQNCTWFVVSQPS